MKRSLTDSQVKEIRKLYKTGKYTELQLATIYGCSTMTISLWKDEDNRRRDKKFKTRARDTTYDGYPKCKHCGIVLHEKRPTCDCRKPVKPYIGSDEYYRDTYGFNWEIKQVTT